MITELEMKVLHSAQALGVLLVQEQQRSARHHELQNDYSRASDELLVAEREYDGVKGDLTCARDMSRSLGAEMCITAQAGQAAWEALLKVAPTGDYQAILAAAREYSKKRKLLANLEEESIRMSAEVCRLDELFAAKRGALSVAHEKYQQALGALTQFNASTQPVPLTEAQNALMEAAAALPSA